MFLVKFLPDEFISVVQLICIWKDEEFTLDIIFTGLLVQEVSFKTSKERCWYETVTHSTSLPPVRQMNKCIIFSGILQMGKSLKMNCRTPLKCVKPNDVCKYMKS